MQCVPCRFMLPGQAVNGITTSCVAIGSGQAVIARDMQRMPMIYSSCVTCLDVEREAVFGHYNIHSSRNCQLAQHWAVGPVWVSVSLEPFCVINAHNRIRKVSISLKLLKNHQLRSISSSTSVFSLVYPFSFCLFHDTKNERFSTFIWTMGALARTSVTWLACSWFVCVTLYNKPCSDFNFNRIGVWQLRLSVK